MARIDRSRLDAAIFRLTITIPTRIDDVDVQWHVNNAAAVVILQEARAKFNFAVGIAPLLGPLRMMVASLRVDYAAEITHPCDVQVATGILAIGRTSFTLGQVARAEGRPALYSEAVMVVAGENGPAPLPEVLRAAFETQRIC